MNRRFFAAALFLGVPITTLGWMLAGCGDDEVFKGQDSGTFDTGPVTDAGPMTEPDGGEGGGPSGCGNSAGAPPRLLLTLNRSSSEVVAFDLTSKKADGEFTWMGSLGQTSSLGTDPYVVEQSNDVVIRMNAQRPWEPIASWSVAGDDRKDGGPNAQPVNIVVPTCGRGYVLRFESNKIAIINTDQVGDGGGPTSYVDLSSLVQPNDKDGRVEMTSALYVPSKKLIYVLLGNWDKNLVASDGYTALCANTKPSIIAIDPTTDKVVSLNGTAPGGGIALSGYSPALGNQLVYDAARDRFLVFNYGCNLDDGDGGAGAVARRNVEEVNLATGQAKQLLDLNGYGSPGSLVLMDGSRAAMTFFFPNQAFFWDPSSQALGPEIPGSIDIVSHDGKGNLVGGRRTDVDGGTLIEVLSIPYTAGDGGTVDASAVQKLGENPFSNNSGFFGGAEVWPRP
jgi:hypothetical protein